MTPRHVPPPVPGVVRPDAALGIHWLDGAMYVYDAGPDSRYAMSWARADVTPGSGPGWHYHTREDEAFYVLRGGLDFFAATDPGPLRLTAGDLVLLPVGVPHRFTATGREASEVVNWTVPGGLQQFFLDLASPLDRAFKVPTAEEFAAAGRRSGAWLLPDGADPAGFVQTLSKGRRAAVRRAGQGDTRRFHGAEVRELLGEADTAAAGELFAVRVPPGAAFPWLQHGRYTAAAFVLAGELTVEGDGVSHAAPPRSLVVCPFGGRYRLSNRGAADAEVLLAACPAGLGELFRGPADAAAATACGVLLG